MRKLTKILRIAILSLVVFSSMSVATESYAYWESSITGDSKVITATVTTGTWTQGFTYDANKVYSLGDVVTHNGNSYTAKKDGLLKEPGVGSWKSDWALN